MKNYSLHSYVAEHYTQTEQIFSAADVTIPDDFKGLLTELANAKAIELLELINKMAVSLQQLQRLNATNAGVLFAMAAQFTANNEDADQGLLINDLNDLNDSSARYSATQKNDHFFSISIGLSLLAKSSPAIAQQKIIDVLFAYPDIADKIGYAFNTADHLALSDDHIDFICQHPTHAYLYIMAIRYLKEQGYCDDEHVGLLRATPKSARDLAYALVHAYKHHYRQEEIALLKSHPVEAASLVLGLSKRSLQHLTDDLTARAAVCSAPAYASNIALGLVRLTQVQPSLYDAEHMPPSLYDAEHIQLILRRPEFADSIASALAMLDSYGLDRPEIHEIILHKDVGDKACNLAQVLCFLACQGFLDQDMIARLQQSPGALAARGMADALEVMLIIPVKASELSQDAAPRQLTTTTPQNDESDQETETLLNRATLAKLCDPRLANTVDNRIAYMIQLLCQFKQGQAELDCLLTQVVDHEATLYSALRNFSHLMDAQDYQDFIKDLLKHAAHAPHLVNGLFEFKAMIEDVVDGVYQNLPVARVRQLFSALVASIQYADASETMAAVNWLRLAGQLNAQRVPQLLQQLKSTPAMAIARNMTGGSSSFARIIHLTDEYAPHFQDLEQMQKVDSTLFSAETGRPATMYTSKAATAYLSALPKSVLNHVTYHTTSLKTIGIKEADRLFLHWQRRRQQRIDARHCGGAAAAAQATTTPAATMTVAVCR